MFSGVVISVCGFVITWTPYAIVFFLLAFHLADSIVSPLATFICACFAKSSVMWIPMLYIATSSHIRLILINTNASDKQATLSIKNGRTANLPAVIRKPENIQVIQVVDAQLQ